MSMENVLTDIIAGINTMRETHGDRVADDYVGRLAQSMIHPDVHEKLDELRDEIVAEVDGER